jgi:hypothetical protein
MQKIPQRSHIDNEWKNDISGILPSWDGIYRIQQDYIYAHKIVSLTHKTQIVFPKIPIDSAVSRKCFIMLFFALN